MSKLNYKSVVWIPCKCPECGHEQEAEAEHYAEHAAKCEHCGEQTKEKKE